MQRIESPMRGEEYTIYPHSSLKSLQMQNPQPKNTTSGLLSSQLPSITVISLLTTTSAINPSGKAKSGPLLLANKTTGSLRGYRMQKAPRASQSCMAVNYPLSTRTTYGKVQRRLPTTRYLHPAAKTHSGKKQRPSTQMCTP